MSWPISIFDHHDVTEEDVRAAEWGEDYDFWADVDRTERLRLELGRRARAAQVGRNAKRQDPSSGLGPQGEHAVGAEGDDAPNRPTPIRTLLMTNKIELLPCPFCGGEVMFRKALWPSDGDVDAVIHENFVSGCGMEVFSTQSTDESVIAAWNTRHPLRSGEGVEQITKTVSDLCDLHRKMLNAVEAARPYPVSIACGQSDLDTVLTAAVELERAKALSTSSSRVSRDGTE